MMSSHNDSFTASGSSPTSDFVYETHGNVRETKMPSLSEGTEISKELPEKKRGRPTKSCVAMTPAERKAASRLNQKQKRQDVERENLITELMKIYRSNQTHIISKVQTHRMIARDQERRYLQDLTGLSIEVLRLAFDVMRDHLDTYGRSAKERMSGGTGALELGEMEAARVGKLLGCRVRPEGAGPDS
jgi:hypothetical protein